MGKEWKVYESKEVTKGLHKLPSHIQKKYKLWIIIVGFGGARNLRNYPGFKDEKLKGELRQCRSSRLNIQYRVVYTEDKKVQEIFVIKVTAHKYNEV